MTVAERVAGTGAAEPVGAVPRDYNFAADVLQSNLDAGRANKPAYIDARGTHTYGQLADRVARFGTALRGLGIKREERVLIALLDTVDWPTAFLGCLKAGIVAVPVNTLLTEDDYLFMLADSRAKCLVVSEALFSRFEKLIKQSPDLEHVIVSGDSPHGYRLFEDLIGADEPEPYMAPTTCDDIAFWLYTSGSTGKPKGAVHVHASLKLTADLYGTPVAGLKVMLRMRPRKATSGRAPARRSRKPLGRIGGGPVAPHADAQAAVDHQGMGVDVARLVRQQEDAGVAHFPAGALAAERHRRRAAGAASRRVATHRRVHQPRQHRIAADRLGLAGHRDRARQRHLRRLRRFVGRVARLVAQRGQ